MTKIDNSVTDYSINDNSVTDQSITDNSITDNSITDNSVITNIENNYLTNVETIENNEINTFNDIDIFNNDIKYNLENNNYITQDITNLETNIFVTNINKVIEEKEIIFETNSRDYKFVNLGNNKFGIKTENGIDEITGVQSIQFKDKKYNIEKDIKKTFEQVTGKDNVTGQIFRLYNAAFARIPDPSGLEYWINQASPNIESRRTIAQSFVESEEFSETYGSKISNQTYVNNLYQNILGRSPDSSGFNYWTNQLNSNYETRADVLMGFSESSENISMFSEVTGLI